MYDSIPRSTNNLFGLRSGQMCRKGKLTHNSGWYNKAGEKLGWGDLSTHDVARIAVGLEAGELFVILSESDSYWNPRKNGISESAPGVAYIAMHAMFIIASGYVYSVDRWSTTLLRTTEIAGMIFNVISQNETTRLIETGKL
jgi:hypothetical protein